MSDPLREFCERYATELMALDETERTREILRMVDRAVVEGEHGVPLVTGMVLRDRRIFDWGDYVLWLARKLPGASGGALFELSVSASVQERPAESAALLARLESEQPLNAYQQRAYAHQLARMGDVAGADARLDRSVELDPGSEREADEYRQFARYFNTFPSHEAQARCAALLETFHLQPPREIAEDVLAAVRDQRGYALIRLNDGEGAIMHISEEDERTYGALYARNRREFHRIWFGNEDHVFDPDFLEAVAEFNAVIPDADCLGAYVNNGLKGEYGWGSLRNVPCLFQVVRKLEQVRDADPERAGRIRMADPLINQFLLLDGELERILHAQTRLGLVSCHAALPAALKARFGLSEVILHRTPGEATITKGLAPEPFRDWHARLKRELQQVERGVLYLVAAGVMGKIYCDLIKRGGGVALDIGAVADIWMRAPTRVFSEQAQRHAF